MDIQDPGVIPRGPIYYRDLLLANIVEFHELDIFRQYKTHYSRDSIHHTSDLVIPEFGDKIIVSSVGDTITWSVEIPAEFEDRTSVTSGRREVQTQYKYKARHEFICNSLSIEPSDERLDSFFPTLNDGDDALTPDLIIEDLNNTIHVIEVTTSRSPNRDVLNRAMEEKIMKYESPLQNRSTTSCVSFTIIVVGIDTVVSNVPIPSELVDELLIRMKIATALENVALTQGILMITTEQEESLSAMATEIKFNIERIEDKDRPVTNGVSISKEYYNSIFDPVDDDFVKDSYGTSLKETREALSGCNVDKHLDNKYIKMVTDVKPCRMDMKPVIHIPLIIPKRTKDSQLPNSIPIAASGKGSEIKKLWSTALADMRKNDSKWKDEDKLKLRKEALEDDPKKLSKFQEERKKHMLSYHRVNMKKALNNETRRYIAKDGVWAKRFSKDPILKARRVNQKKPFSYRTDVSDIERFLRSKELFEAMDLDQPEYFDRGIELLTQANNMAGNSSINEVQFKTWTKTRLFTYLEFISDVSMELAASCNQHTKGDELLLKKLRFWDCYLLISLTNSKSHIFFSLLFPKQSIAYKDDQTIFKSVFESTYTYITDFTSVRVDKIENIASSSSSLITFVSFWAWFCNLGSVNLDDFKKSSEACHMMLLTILVRLEDKAQTEEIITQTRYMYMEIFKNVQSIITPDPMKVLSKFPKVIRSRLALYCIKCIIRSFRSMMNLKPIKEPANREVVLQEGEDTLPGDEWHNLINCYTMRPIANASKAVSLFYLGYVKNKNEVAQGNADFKLIEKILEEENKLNLDEMERSYGLTPPKEVPKTKQFSKECIKHGCHIMRRRLKNMFSAQWEIVVEHDILERLAKQLTHYIATLKASSTCEHKANYEQVSHKNNGKVKRVKVIEAIASNLRIMGLNPLLNLESIIKKIENSCGGIIADLFKKNQHGGLREIYVLPIEDRILQLFIETISRTLCSYFEEETLTHPENKLKLLDRHTVRASRYSQLKNASHADYCNSSDKTRWNQNFVMTAMCIPLFLLTPKLFHNPIKRILNLWADKLIKIPPSVCTLLLSKTKLKSEAYDDLLHKFWSPSGKHKSRNYIRRICSAFVNVTTGMMQGILHYSSSLLHIAFLSSSKFFTMAYLKVRHPRWSFMMTQVCSSDDSATILSLFTETKPDDMNRADMMAVIDTEICLHALTVFCKYFCMQESIKSTIAMNDYIEFNSEFLFKNTVAHPIIKLCAASTNMTESESFITRFHTMYNLLSDLAQAGFPSKYTSFVQWGQGWLHYKTMGLSMNGLFNDYYTLILENPNCVYGFFYLDTELLTGVMGYSFTEYLAIDSSETLATLLQVMDTEELDATPDGGLTKALVVKHGDLRKWHTLLDRITLGKMQLKDNEKTMKFDKQRGKTIIDEKKMKTRHEELQKLPELYFRNPRNLSELKTKLLMKASMPGVGKSLGKGNPFIQSLSMSLYAINTHCFTKTSLCTIVTGGVTKLDKKTGKVNILGELIRDKARMSGIILDSNKYEAMMALKFPLQRRYIEVVKIIQQYGERNLIPIHRMRHRKNRVIINPKQVPLPISLSQTLSKLWFGFQLKVTDRVYNRCLNEYKLQYSWIKDTFSDSLKASYFNNNMELCNFVSSVTSKTRKLNLCGPGIYSNMFSGQIHQIIRKYYLDGKLLVPDGHSKPLLESLDKQMVQLGLALSIPTPGTRNRYVNASLNNIKIDEGELQDLSSRPKRELIVLLIAAFKQGKIKSEDIYTAIRTSRVGNITLFPKPQNKVVENGIAKWKGIGEALVLVDGLTLKLYLRDDAVEAIACTNFKEVKRYPQVIQDILVNLGVRICYDRKIVLRAIAKFSGSRFLPVTARGVSIIQDESLFIPYVESSELQLRIRHNTVGLFTRVRDLMTPVLEFHPGPKDLHSISNTSPSEDFWLSWIEVRPATTKSAYSFVTAAAASMDQGSSRMSRPIIAENETTKWIKNSITSRLKFLNIGYSCEDYSASILGSMPDSEEAQDIIDDDWLNDFLTEAMEDDNTQFALNMETHITEAMRSECEEFLARSEKGATLLESIEELEMDIYGLADSPFTMMFHNLNDREIPGFRSVVVNKHFDYIYMHPIWDELINQICNNDREFFDKLLQGITSSTDRDMSRLFMKVCNIKEKHVELTLTEQFKRGKPTTQDYLEEILEAYDSETDDESS